MKWRLWGGVTAWRAPGRNGRMGVIWAGRVTDAVKTAQIEQHVTYKLITVKLSIMSALNYDHDGMLPLGNGLYLWRCAFQAGDVHPIPTARIALCDATSAAFAMIFALGQLDVTHSAAESSGWRSRARDADPQPSGVERLESL